MKCSISVAALVCPATTRQPVAPPSAATNKRTNERTNERTSEQTDKQTNETGETNTQTKKCLCSFIHFISHYICPRLLCPAPCASAGPSAGPSAVALLGYAAHSLPPPTVELAAFSPALSATRAPKGKTQRPNKMVKKQTSPTTTTTTTAQPSSCATCHYFMPLQRNSIAFFAFNKVCVRAGYVSVCGYVRVRVFVRMLQAYLQLAVLLKYSPHSSAIVSFASCLLPSPWLISLPAISLAFFLPASLSLDSANKNNEKCRQIKFAQIIIYVYVICVHVCMYLYSFSRILFLYLHKMH